MAIAFLYDAKAPFDGVRPGVQALAELARHGDVLPFSQAGSAASYDAFVNLHGAYFPKDAFEELVLALHRGAGLVCAGGKTPFSVPVRADGIAERAQNGYHQRLNIHHALTMKAERLSSLSANERLPLLAGKESCFSLADTLGLLVRFTRYKDVPSDHGSAGPIDGMLLPLLSGYGEGGRPTAAPAVLIENVKGEYAGGRWTFVNQELTQTFWQNGGAGVLCDLAEYASHGAVEAGLQPNYASYFPGEQPALNLRWQRLAGAKRGARMEISIAKDGEALWAGEFVPEAGCAQQYRVIPTDVCIGSGLYDLTTTISIDGEPKRILSNGFWGYDHALLEGGDELTCDRDYFMKGDKPQPIVGMTYMQSDIHRKFLDLPNPHIWDSDMAEMARAGINMIRTGIWTGHRNAAFVDGLVREDHLRAVDAFVMTAKKHDIPVVFNFFSFTPEPWEGINPYLDPRSIEAQKRYISAFVSRHAASKGVSWDLINEPSLMTLHTNWGPAVSGDKYEQNAWREWLAKRHGSIEALQERWHMTPAQLPSFAEASLPEADDFITAVTHTTPQKAMRVHDYLLFQQSIHNRWASALVGAIRDAGSAAPVTVGQDEGLNAYRPSPLFYQEAVDYTTCHSWWLNDDLYWDGVFSKDRDKPCLIQETGIMYVQTATSDARRTQDELRNILERKYALAFAADNAGAVHWLWNINVHMDSFNEINIGAIMADGSHKLEADVSYDFGAFMRKAGHLFRGRKLPEVSIVFPYANNFSVRDGALAASKRAIRVLGYDLGVPVQAYGEYHLGRLPEEGLILMPCARSLSCQAWDTLMDRVSKGATLLLTGPFSYDAYFARVPERSKALGMDTYLAPIAREEELFIDGASCRVSFGGNAFEWVDVERICGAARDELTELCVGNGKVLLSPLPIELATQDDATAAVYQRALKAAGVNIPFEWVEGRKVGLLVKKLEMESGSVWVLVSERAQDCVVALGDVATGVVYRTEIPAGRAMLFAADKAGRVIATYRDQPVVACEA